MLSGYKLIEISELENTTHNLITLIPENFGEWTPVDQYIAFSFNTPNA